MPSLTNPTATKLRPSELKKLLFTFYEKPIAQVSTELFFTILTVIFFALFAIRPTIVTMTELVKEIEDKRETDEALAKKVTALSTAQSEYFALQDEFPLLEEVMPVNVDVSQLVKIIEKVASEEQLSVTAIQVREVPLPPLAEPEFSKVNPLTLNTTVGLVGKYENGRRFLEKLTELRPLITLNTISFTRSNDRTNPNALVINVQLDMHYFREGGLEKGKPGSQGADEITEENL